MKEGIHSTEGNGDPLAELNAEQIDQLDHALNYEGFDLDSVRNMLSYLKGDAHEHLADAVRRCDAKEIVDIIG